MKDYYKILEIQPDASLEVMNNAYRALVKKYHPDLFHTKLKASMTAKMLEINEAYNTLSVPITRAEYDRTRAQYQPVSQPFTTSFQWKRILLWALGSFLVFRFLIKPLLFSSFGKIILFGAVLFGIYKLMQRSKRP